MSVVQLAGQQTPQALAIGRKKKSVIRSDPPPAAFGSVFVKAPSDVLLFSADKTILVSLTRNVLRKKLL